ncbi:hypothetical protein ABL78_0729 [Leptomonas seymouri]|uniref:Uncharacterized protein n=1 Tax=Leptomonas seymouri TaxID=5684 RepID=A0A0N1IMF5_LEPSE|nr:hypothetical protein ABL78_0729 [Leptomonas seymouri]|eukprot:KPI90211.1 hypothetical protein ABL78_0729 [Leptomonas seymouri]
MNFKDPFANDLNNFRSVVAGLRQASSLPTGSDFGRGQGGGTSLASSLLFSPNTSGQTGAALGDVGAGPLSYGSGASGVSVSTSAANPAPVAGRRARVTPSVSSPFSVAPSSVPPVSGSVASPLPPPVQQTQPQPSAPLTHAPRQASAAPSALSWLDDINPAPSPPAARQQGLPPSSTSKATSFTAAAPQGAPTAVSVPSFLNFDVGDGVGSAAPPPPREALHQHAASPAPISPESAAAAEAETKKVELRDLYATLDALDMEQQRLDERLDIRQLKEEAELLALETSVATKTNELADKEETLAAKHTELASHTEERLRALSSRYTREMEAQSAEVRSLDGARFEKQLQQVRTQCAAAEESVKSLREQAALALALEPFSEKGVRVALSAATAASATPGHSDLKDESGDTESSAPLETGLQKAVDLLRAYCDQRLGHARERLVDYVHTETLEAAHAVRRKREHVWADDAVEHKTLFNQYLASMMQRYMLFYKERALLKQQHIESLQSELRSTASELRNHAATRLEGLLRDVTAKITMSTDHQTKSAEEAKSRLQHTFETVLEADKAMGTKQRSELASRQLAEAQARRQRFQAEEQSLLDQQQRLRRSNETSARDGFQSLRDTAASCGIGRAQILDEEAAALRTRVNEKLRGIGSSSSSELRSASSIAHMRAEELVHVIRRALAEETAQQHSLSLAYQRCDELRSALLHSIREGMVERLQHTRCAQHAHQSRIDAQRKAWEAAHRQNLAAACSLVLPISGSTAQTEDVQYVTETYAAPQDVASIAWLDVLRDKLQSRDDARRRLLQSRKECATRCFRLLDNVRAQQETIQTTWQDLWDAAQTLLTQQTASHEIQLDVERGLITVVAQQQSVARDRRNAERECRRIADVTQRLKAEAAQCGVDTRLLCAPPELLEAGGGAVSAVQPLPLATALLHTAGPSAIHRLPEGSKFTAVHTSTNAVAGAYSKAEASNPAATLPAASSTTTVSPPLRASDLANANHEGGATAPGHTQHQGDSSKMVDVTSTTTTQPWSSALLRAEQLLSASSAEETHVVAEGLRPPALAEQGSHRGGADVNRGSSASHAENEEAKQSSGSARCDSLQTASFTSPSAPTDEVHRNSSNLHSTENPPQLSSSTLVDTDTGMQQGLRVSPSIQWQLQRRHGRASALFETLSTLEEFRSGVDRSSSAMRDPDNSGDRTTLSFDDSTNFVELLSCTDSSVSSYQTR